MTCLGPATGIDFSRDLEQLGNLSYYRGLAAAQPAPDHRLLQNANIEELLVVQAGADIEDWRQWKRETLPSRFADFKRRLAEAR